MNLKEIIDLPNQISIPLLIHKIENTNKRNKLAHLGEFTIYLEMRSYIRTPYFFLQKTYKI